MEIEIQLTRETIPEKIYPPGSPGTHGAWLEFRGVVRGEEKGKIISRLEYEAYPEMAEREIRRILEMLSPKHPCLAVKVVHRVGVIPVGDTAIYVGIESAHRGEAITLLTDFMNQLKQNVPIWKARAVTELQAEQEKKPLSPASVANGQTKPLSLDEALANIQEQAQPLPGARVALTEVFGRVLREKVCASEDFPACDRSTRDGYAILEDDSGDMFHVVDTLHAADWKPRQLKLGEAVRVSTGSALPCENLRVVMQEDVERTGDCIKVLFRESGTNIRKRGEEIRGGGTVLEARTNLNAGTMALLAMVGCVKPLVSPRLRVAHFTTGNEVVPPDQTPKPGQIRDSNSILVRAMLEKFPCDIFQSHLRENLDEAKSQIAKFKSQIENVNVLLISGGASVGEKDFTRELLAHLGFEIVFSRLNVRPGAPLIFGTSGRQIAFGLPGNPVSHFVCFHLFVAPALRGLTGAQAHKFLTGTLASKFDDAPNSRETFWPTRWDSHGLHPLKWMSSGDTTCLAEANALIRVPPNSDPMDTGAKVEFLPI
ncbi:MAG TPA: molybdenum cofactor biosynthesis protein MoaE [Pseudomonadales bacterium]|nr:molybdenum cofactor biosynthesis protein MoaE [Pseudomonadales bacterium]